MVGLQVNTSFAIPCFQQFEYCYQKICEKDYSQKNFFFVYVFLATYLELFLQATFQGIILVVFNLNNLQQILDWREKQDDREIMKFKLDKFLTIFAVDKNIIKKLQSLFEAVQTPRHPLIHGHEIFYTSGYIKNQKSQKTLQYFTLGKLQETINAYKKFRTTWSQALNEVKNFCDSNFTGLNIDFQKDFLPDHIE